MTAIIDGKYKYLWAQEGKRDSMGGTELMTMKLAELADPELLKECWIISSRFPDNSQFPDDKVRIYWAHDHPYDPANQALESKAFADKFHKFVFVSNWQMQRYIDKYKLPWNKCVVLRNAIDPIDVPPKPDIKEKIRLIYHPTPRRGLNILLAVYDRLVKKYPGRLQLDLFSSHALYGWDEADAEYQFILDKFDELEGVNNHGFQPQEVVREHLAKAHIFTYPCAYVETSCLCLIEAMSAGCVSVHSNLGALYETAANWTQEYGYSEDSQQHASIFYNVMCGVIDNLETVMKQQPTVKGYADAFYGWQSRTIEWNALLGSLVNTIEDRSLPKSEMFTVNTG